MQIEKYIDHTLLKADATSDQIEQLCQEARKYHFASVCINPSWIPFVKKALNDSDVKICTVIGFPLGANTTAVKVFETTDAVSMGADEIDMVINISKAKEGDFDYIEEEIRAVVRAAKGKLVKVILETCLLSKGEIELACNAAVNAKADFVKTSTGFSSGGATVEAVTLMKHTVGTDVQVKASGGVRSKEDLEAMIHAGATRIGTSAGVALMNNTKHNSNY